MVTVIVAVVSPVLHNNAPVKPDAVNTEFSQLSTTDTMGADGITLGAAMPLASGLAHPFTSLCYCISFRLWLR